MRFRIPSLELPSWVGWIGAGLTALGFIYLFPEPYQVATTRATYRFALMPQGDHWTLDLPLPKAASVPGSAIRGRIDTVVEITGGGKGSVGEIQITTAEVTLDSTPPGVDAAYVRKVLDGMLPSIADVMDSAAPDQNMRTAVLSNRNHVRRMLWKRQFPRYLLGLCLTGFVYWFLSGGSSDDDWSDGPSPHPPAASSG